MRLTKYQLIKWGMKQSPKIYTLTDIAEALGVSRNVLNNYIANRYVSDENINKIEKARK